MSRVGVRWGEAVVIPTEHAISGGFIWKHRCIIDDLVGQVVISKRM
jgi:hypothetical protein